jgi:hypothetical protein
MARQDFEMILRIFSPDRATAFPAAAELRLAKSATKTAKTA